MSTKVLTNLRDYLTGTLSTADLTWLIDQMTDYLQAQQQQPRRYTKEEINAMLDEAEAEIAAGKGIPHDEAMKEWEEEIKEQEFIEYAQVV